MYVRISNSLIFDVYSSREIFHVCIFFYKQKHEIYYGNLLILSALTIIKHRDDIMPFPFGVFNWYSLFIFILVFMYVCL